MALYMLWAKYTPAAAKSIMESDVSREDEVRKLIEAAGGKLVGFYGLIGQGYHVAIIADMPGTGEYIGVVVTGTMSGAIEDFKTIPMYGMDEMEKAKAVYAKVKPGYKPPT